MDWSELIKEIHDLQKIQSDEKERILKGWIFLEEVLGPKWLEDAATRKHPWIRIKII